MFSERVSADTEGVHAPLPSEWVIFWALTILNWYRIGDSSMGVRLKE